ncbi:MAG: DUF4854 domain-containing protein [Bacteroidales bacterium]|nr:DUF4854 domain-containing protein [Lachnoclostridium sp.]MCM1382992.1 DUF4854 domain-containing protein [Lachnoclostridium sp.]MCM1463954.1 DUF4854 domain-containing protein [Bacteroidales bacterium]
MKKKFLIILLSLLFIFSLAGCGSVRTLEEPPQTDSSDRPTETDSSTDNTSTENLSAKNPSVDNASMDTASMDTTSMDTTAAESTPKEILSLQDWLDSENKEQNVAGANAQLNPIGLSLDFYAEDDNILVLEYTFSEQQDLGDDMAEIHTTFYKSLATVYSDSITSLFDDFASEYQITLEDIKLVFRNADGTELYSRYYKE